MQKIHLKVPAGNIPLSCLFMLLFSLLLIEGVFADAAPDKGGAVYQISDISLNSSFLKVSPGDTINPAVVVTCTGTDPDTNASMKFHATLGPVRLISKDTSWTLPEPGESKTIPLSFTIPSVQPGRYALTIYLGSAEGYSVNNPNEQQIKANELIQVTSPKSGLGVRDCGCS